MEQLTLSPEANPLRFSHARLHVTRASMERRNLFRRVVVQLSRNPSAAVARALSILQEHDLELLEMTSEHIAAWPAARIKANWLGYCEATRAIRQRSRSNIERERQLLYPLLGGD
jgi:hypothetical protein